MSWFKIRPAIPKNAPKLEATVEESLLTDHFQIAKVVRHGFPYQPTALAFDPVQNLLAIGTKSGSIRIIGRPGVDRHIRHEAEFAVIQILFLINEGALVSVCADDQLHLWSLRQKKPEIIHALKFQKERITFCHLPFQSKWLYIGTQKGNVHVLNLESFVLSGYIINWNKAMELIRRTHPGPVVHLNANQSDPNKLLIVYESGLLTLWDLKSKVAECHFNCKEIIKSVSWHHEGKQFICSHGDGSLTTWNVKSPQQPVSTILPHGKLGRDGKPETCRAINKVELCTNRSSDPFTVFSGGMPVEKAGQTPTLTIMHGSNTTVLEMEYQIVDFVVLCSTPWNNDFQDPYAVIVLLQNDFIVIDLTSTNYPCFENPCPMDIHESPVTACCYFSNCPTDLLPAFYSVGYRQKKTRFSDKEWPIKGGEWPSVATSYEEIIITGHADGSIKFWNAPGVTLQVLYKLKTAKMFDETQCNYGPDIRDSPFAVQIITLCVESRLLCVAGMSYLSLFRFNKQEATIECTPIEITLIYDISDGSESPDADYPSLPTAQFYTSNSQNLTCVRLKSGPRKWSSGYQPDLCCILTWVDGEPPSPITSATINSKYGLLVLGNDAGLAIIDILQKTCLLSIGTPDLYGSMDPYSRSLRSPKLKSASRSQGFDGSSYCMTPDDVKSPNFEQLQDRTDSSTFSRSQSSSISSLDNVSKEAIQCLILGEFCFRKSDCITSPCLWVGTSLGSVLVLSINLPSDSSARRVEPVSASASGTVFRLKGSILALAFLDVNGVLIPSSAEPWKDFSRDESTKERKPYCRQQSTANLKVNSSVSSTDNTSDQQFAVLCSERQARVIALPSQTCISKVKLTDSSSAIKADAVQMKESTCLVCYVQSGRILIFTLPSLKPLFDVDLVSSPDVRVARTLCISSNCNILYFCSPSELQKITLSAEMCENLNDMLGELFVPRDMPEPPKQNFFRNLFSAGSATLDREELFGERSGKPARGVANYVSGISQTQDRATLACSEIGRAKLAAIERGEKLGELDEKTAQMMLDAEIYAQRANQIKNKYRDRKWYQF